MPYPIANLAYGLRCRLNKLATPVERYHLQIAAGNPSICPPLQKQSTEKNHFLFSYQTDDVVITANGVSFDFEQNGLVYRVSNITIENATMQNLSSEASYYFLCQVPRMHLFNCGISLPFIQTLSKVVTATENIRISNNTNVDYVLNFADILEAFPHLYKLWIKDVPFADTWMSDITLFDHPNFKELEFTMTIEQFNSYSFDEFIQFLKAQKKGFSLKININGTECNSQFLLPLVQSALKKKLLGGHSSNNLTKFCICYNWTTTTTWCLPPDDVKLNNIYDSIYGF